MPESRTNVGWPNVLVLILCFLALPLGLLVWVLGNGTQRAAYLRSW